MNRDVERLRDALDAAQKITELANRGRAAFDGDPLIQVWIIHHLEIVGEALAHVSSSLESSHPEIPWRPVVAMRNILAHDYGRIDNEVVWHAAVNGIPDLANQLATLLDSLQD